MDQIKEDKPASKDFLTNLWEGNFGLAITYWVYGVLGGIVWGVGISALNPEQGSDLTKIVLLLLAAYYFVAYVGIWQGANKYTGSKVWAILAKFAVVVSVVPVAIHFVKWLIGRLPLEPSGPKYFCECNRVGVTFSF